MTKEYITEWWIEKGTAVMDAKRWLLYYGTPDAIVISRLQKNYPSLDENEILIRAKISIFKMKEKVINLAKRIEELERELSEDEARQINQELFKGK